jgi:hypothetical protein
MKPNEGGGIGNEEQDGEQNPIGDAKEDGDSHWNGSGWVHSIPL